MVNVLECLKAEDTYTIGLFNNTLFSVIPLFGVANYNDCFLRRNSKLRGSTNSLQYSIKYKTFSTLNPEEELVKEVTQQFAAVL